MVSEATAEVGKRERDANGSKFANASNSAVSESKLGRTGKCKLVSGVNMDISIRLITSFPE